MVIIQSGNNFDLLLSDIVSETPTPGRPKETLRIIL